MNWRTWNRGRGPEMPDMAGRSIGSALRGEKKGFNAYLRPGQSRASSRREPGNEEDDELMNEMGDIERTARTLKLPQNPVDVRSKPQKSSTVADGVGRNGDRRKTDGRNTPPSLTISESEERFWNGSTFCPAQFHPKSLSELVQRNLQNFFKSTNDVIGGRAGKPLDPAGLFEDVEKDQTTEFAAELYKEAICYPRW